MMITSTGAMYLIMIVQAPAAENLLEMRTSSMMVLGFTIQPTNTQVSSATMGMSTELEMKSAKSRIEEPAPSGSMNDSPL